MPAEKELGFRVLRVLRVYPESPIPLNYGIYLKFGDSYYDFSYIP